MSVPITSVQLPLPLLLALCPSGALDSRPQSLLSFPPALTDLSFTPLKVPILIPCPPAGLPAWSHSRSGLDLPFSRCPISSPVSSHHCSSPTHCLLTVAF